LKVLELSSIERKSTYGVVSHFGFVFEMTMAQTVEKQERFFCENCKREVFLSGKYCDGCGGEIKWPKKVQKILSTWKKPPSKK